MEELALWEMEVLEIEATCSPEARLESWAEILASLWTVEDFREFERLGLKAIEIAKGDPIFGNDVEARIEEIWLERRRTEKASAGVRQ